MLLYREIPSIADDKTSNPAGVTALVAVIRAVPSDTVPER